MSTAHTRGSGMLVIHTDGAAAWMSPLVAAVASVRLGVGTGAVVEIDAANPTLVLGWGLQAGGDVAALAEALGEPHLEEQLRVLADSGDEVFAKAAPELAAPWIRRATVAAVGQCTVRPLHESALWLDQAAADYTAGRTEAATGLFQLAAPSLLDLGEDCLAGMIDGGAATDLAGIAGIAARSLEGSGWEADVSALADRLYAEVGFDDADLVSALADWAPTLVGAGHLGQDVDADTGTAGHFVDPRAVPSHLLRLLVWSGPAEHDVSVVWQRGSRVASVSAALSEDADRGTIDPAEFIAYAADPGTTSVVAVAPMTRDGASLVASLTCDRDPGELHFGIHHTDSELASPRVDSVGRLLVEVDRRMYDAYTHHRFAIAALHGRAVTNVVSAESLRDEHLEQARDAALGAGVLIEDYLGVTDVDDATRTLLTARSNAIDAYRTVLEPGGPVTGEPALLSELLAAAMLDD